MASGNLTVAGNVSGGPDGARTFGPFSVPANTAVLETLLVSLINGATTVTVPAGATAAVIVPPNAAVPTPNPPNAGVLTLKGVSGDTGVVISNKYPTVLTWDTAPASFVVASTAAATAEIWFM